MLEGDLLIRGYKEGAHPWNVFFRRVSDDSTHMVTLERVVDLDIYINDVLFRSGPSTPRPEPFQSERQRTQALADYLTISHVKMRAEYQLARTIPGLRVETHYIRTYQLC